MSLFTYNEVERIRSSLVNELSIYKPEWQLAAMFVAPQRFRNPGQKKVGQGGRQIFKNRAGRSLQTFVSGMSNGATPRTRPWFKREVANERKMRLSNVKRYLADSDAVINQHFQMSNLYGVLPMSYKDVGVFSNSAYAMLPHPVYGFYFYPYAIGTYAFACDLEGNTNMFTRDFSLTVKQVVDSYGTLNKSGQIDWSKFPEYVQQCYMKADYNQTIMLNETYLPNKSYDPAKVNKLDYKTKKFQRYVSIRTLGSGLPIQSSTGFRNEKGSDSLHEFIRVDGFSYFPVITPRWEVQAEENYGVDGPTQMAISDIMTLQEMQKGRLEGVNKLLRPPMVGHSSLRRHQASILAGGITYVDDQGAAHGFKPAFEMDPKISELVNSMQEYEDEIRYAYFEHLFLQFSGEETKSHVTAAEINERSAEKMAALAPVMGQLDRDQNGPIIRNAQLILEELGRMPPRPKEIEGEEMRPEYISILAQASKVSMLNSMERGMNFLVTASDALQRPSLRKLIDAEAYAREYLDYVAIKPTMVLDESEFAKAEEQIAQQQQQMQALQQQQMAASTAKDLSQAEVGRGSMLDAMMDASST